MSESQGHAKDEAAIRERPVPLSTPGVRRHGRGALALPLASLLLLPSLALADMPPPGPLDLAGDPGALLAALLIVGCIAALGLWGLGRMARESARIEADMDSMDSGEEAS